MGGSSCPQSISQDEMPSTHTTTVELTCVLVCTLCPLRSFFCVFNLLFMAAYQFCYLTCTHAHPHPTPPHPDLRDGHQVTSVAQSMLSGPTHPKIVVFASIEFFPRVCMVVLCANCSILPAPSTHPPLLLTAAPTQSWPEAPKIKFPAVIAARIHFFYAFRMPCRCWLGCE